ncbi:hypothetical protein [uncultured Paludibaculum sp.]|uniref:hypothetical protein n=1 Tax=uncultured Paludibaculum sp. TaxID=1765020 RepID=UPI002AAB8476|nr:hypothetical protein [uncultured Paludibaculum sp.]
MIRGRFALLALPVLLAGCVKYPEPFRPPVQRRPMEIGGDLKLSHFTAMGAATAPDHFISGVVPDLHDGAWRWVMKKPIFQFQLPTTKALRLKVDLSVPEVTFEQTGPVKITVMVGPHLLDTIECSKPGQHLFEKAVPEEWLSVNRPILVSLEIDKLWTSPADGVQRGFIITSIGFVQ